MADSVRVRSPKRKAPDDNNGLGVLRAAVEEWNRVALAYPKDATVRRVRDVLLALHDIAGRHPEDTGDTAEKLADTARKYLADRGKRAATRPGPRAIECVEDSILNGGRYPAGSPKLASEIVFTLSSSRAFGRPVDGFEAAVVRAEKAMRRLLDRDLFRLQDDVELTVRRVLVAYGLTPAEAQNAYKFRTARLAPRLSSDR